MHKSEKVFVTAGELSGLLDISTGHAYKIIRQLNKELEAKGYIIVAGKVSRKYMEERCYGLQHKESSVI